MKEARKLVALVEIARRGAERARAELHRVGAEIDALEQQHGHLCRYVDDYRQGLARAPATCGAGDLAHRHRFVGRLENQVRDLERHLERRRESMAPIVERHREAAARESALTALHARAERHARARRDRREARDADERVALHLSATRRPSASQENTDT